MIFMSSPPQKAYSYPSKQLFTRLPSPQVHVRRAPGPFSSQNHSKTSTFLAAEGPEEARHLRNSAVSKRPLSAVEGGDLFSEHLHLLTEAQHQGIILEQPLKAVILGH